MKYVSHDIISNGEIDQLISIFNNHSEYTYTAGMKKVGLDPNNSDLFELLTDIISNRLNITGEYDIIGDNFFEHSYSYFPHCDALQDNSWLNILIPLKLYNQRQLQEFIVFDQQYTAGGATWIGNYPLDGNFLYNKKLSSRICESDNVINLTDTTIDDKLYNSLFQKYMPSDYLFGMSGTVFNWSPGDVIVFNSKYIHSTGKMQCLKKLGLSIRIGHKK